MKGQCRPSGGEAVEGLHRKAEHKMHFPCTGIRNDFFFPEDRVQSAVERSEKFAPKGVIYFCRPAIWLSARLDAVHVWAGPA